ncbi:hypothetical protein HK099_007011, partial [Clydaea vesicula]
IYRENEESYMDELERRFFAERFNEQFETKQRVFPSKIENLVKKMFDFRNEVLVQEGELHPFLMGNYFFLLFNLISPFENVQGNFILGSILRDDFLLNNENPPFFNLNTKSNNSLMYLKMVGLVLENFNDVEKKQKFYEYCLDSYLADWDSVGF